MPLDHRFAKALLNRGNMHQSAHRYDRALADYSAAVKVDPQNAYLLYSRGLTLRAQGMEAESKLDIAKAKEIEPGIGPLNSRSCGGWPDIFWPRCNKSIGRSAGAALDISVMSETETADPHSPAVPIPSNADLFLAFFKITLSGFGGTLPWTRRMFVEKKRWVTAEEFNDLYALCQFLPGPNIVNLTSVFGSRMRGPTGAAAAWCGFLLVPFCVMLAAGILYERYGDVDAVRRVLSGVGPAAAGLIIATVAKMAAPMFRGFGPAAFVLLAVAFAIGIMRWPLLLVLIVAAPVSIGLAWMRHVTKQGTAPGGGA